MTEPTLLLEHVPAPIVPRIVVLASYQYLNYGAVVERLTALGPAEFAIASQIGVGHSLLTHFGGHSLNVSPLKWQPTRPHLEVKAERAVLFWDGHDKSLLPSVVILKKAAVPISIFDVDGNPVDLAHFCATLTNGDKSMATSAPATPSTATPSVIVDAPLQPGAPISHVLVKLSIPANVYAQYEEQAKLAKQSVEKTLADRLRTCVAHTSGRGLYFNDAQRSALERITGGHIISDAETALTKVRMTVEIDVGGVTVELNDRVLARCATRAKSERKTFEQYVTRNVIEGLERCCGLRPW